MPSGDVTESNVARQGTEKRNSLFDEHRHASANEPLNEPCVVRGGTARCHASRGDPNGTGMGHVTAAAVVLSSHWPETGFEEVSD